MRALVYYLLIFAVMTVYGAQVCPFIATLPTLIWAQVMFAFLGAAYLIRFWADKKVSAAALERQTMLQFKLELGVLLLAGLGVGVFDILAFSFPLGSGLKVVLGCGALGFMAAVDMAYARERRVIEEVRAGGRRVELGEKLFPLTVRFLALAIATVLLVGAVVMLLIYRDLDILAKSPGMSLQQVVNEIFVEIIFVALVLLGLIANLSYSFSKNLRLFFANQNQALKAVAKGDLNSAVPVASPDEFGVMASYTNQMITTLKNRTEELSVTQDATITALASLAETRDNETGAHILRTQRYVKALAAHLATHPDFTAQLDEATVELLFKSAPLHDAGKVGVPDSILLKPGKLTPEEFEEMKRHTIYGRDTLESAERMLGHSSFLHLARQIAYSHHEKWDGSGYPRGIAGEDIPLSGRLMALADVYDALISKRVYKPAFSHDKAKAIILEGKGAHFDPRVVEAFQQLEDEFIRIAQDFADGKECRLARAC